MGCNIKTIEDDSSLYKNGLLIDRARVNFDILVCDNINITINTNSICCGKRKFNRITVFVENLTNEDINDGKLRVLVTSNNFYLNKEFEIYNIKNNSEDSVYIDVPFNCCFNYMVRASVEVEGRVLKESNISI